MQRRDDAVGERVGKVSRRTDIGGKTPLEHSGEAGSSGRSVTGGCEDSGQPRPGAPCAGLARGFFAQNPARRETTRVSCGFSFAARTTKNSSTDDSTYVDESLRKK
jgi:hypothetical protein